MSDTIEQCKALFPVDSFMQPQVQFDHYYEVDTTHSTEIVPCDVLGQQLGTITARLLTDYCEGRICEPDDKLHPRTGWLARMSADGYMDCTAWCDFPTELEAWQYLATMYGD